MRLPSPRGPLSDALLSFLNGSRDSHQPWPDPANNDDLHLSLWTLYELHYRGFDDVDDGFEWNPSALALRAALEEPFEAEIERLVKPVIALEERNSLVEQLQVIVDRRGSGLPAYLERKATADQFREYLTMRSVYHLKESDPQAWVLPRIDGQAKASLAELLYDEYGDGRGSRVHQELFAKGLAEAGLDSAYGAYIDCAPAHILAVNNAMSLFGLHRRWRGAAMGHLAAFEMTSTTPCRRIARGAKRLGMGAAVERYYDEHVEADAVHEHLASRSICGSLVRDEPDLHDQILFGAAAAVTLEKVSGTATLSDWAAGTSALRADPHVDPAE